ncbi:MAG: mercury methylation ferredoxin HgcB [Syntrophaceae bacterium]|nr:mercury methylation ferredoxin HgcB [Syntrophaceae bacterium]
MKKVVYLRNVSTLKLNTDLCVGCEVCINVCPRGVFAKENGSVKIIDLDACIECGACQKNCYTKAVQVRTGVGCATAVINTALGKKGSNCCCVVEPCNSDSQKSSIRSSGCC